MRFAREHGTGFWGLGIWVKPQLKLITIHLLLWQFRLYWEEK